MIFMRVVTLIFFAVMLVSCGSKGNRVSEVAPDSDSVTVDEYPVACLSSADSANLHGGEVCVRTDNYRENDSCCNGVVVYEGSKRFFIVSTPKGFSVVKVLRSYLHEGDVIRGVLEQPGVTFAVKNRNDDEICVKIVSSRIMKDAAIRWLGENKYLKSHDQKDFDNGMF